MTDTPLDPKREQMIAALYGELSPEEMEAFRVLLKEDTELAREWEELRGTRSFLQKAGAEMEAHAEEQAGAFSFLSPEEEAPSAGRADRAGKQPDPGPPTRPDAAPAEPVTWGARWRKLLLSPATGFAAAALTLAVLMLSGLRVDRVEGGLAIRFAPETGHSGQADLASAAPAESTDRAGAAGRSSTIADPALSGGIPLETASGPGAPAGTSAGALTGAGGGSSRPGSQAQADALGGYVTRADLAVFADQLTRMLEERLRETRQVTRSEFVYLLNEFNQTLGERRVREQERFDSQLEDMWLGVVGMMAAGGNPAFQGQSANPEDVRVSPVHQVAPDQEEGR